MISAEEWESAHETLFWLSQSGIHKDIAEADIEAGRVYDEVQVRQALNLPPQR
jgi:PHD/YefM family antitoxin component YafN of YafNO toxin-antitoxin module